LIYLRTGHWNGSLARTRLPISQDRSSQSDISFGNDYIGSKQNSWEFPLGAKNGHAMKKKPTKEDLSDEALT
jgi:hypothetical protein